MTRDDIQAVAELAIDEAKTFWQLDPKWDVSISVHDFEDDTGGDCHLNARYYMATIRIDSGCPTPAEVWRIAGHEAAHIALAELDVFAETESQQQSEAFKIAVERTAAMLERVFERERPCTL